MSFLFIVVNIYSAKVLKSISVIHKFVEHYYEAAIRMLPASIINM